MTYPRANLTKVCNGKLENFAKSKPNFFCNKNFKLISTNLTQQIRNAERMLCVVGALQTETMYVCACVCVVERSFEIQWNLCNKSLNDLSVRRWCKVCGWCSLKWPVAWRRRWVRQIYMRVKSWKTNFWQNFTNAKVHRKSGWVACEECVTVTAVSKTINVANWVEQILFYTKTKKKTKWNFWVRKKEQQQQ